MRSPVLHTHVVVRDRIGDSRDVVVIRVYEGAVASAHITSRVRFDETGTIVATVVFDKPRSTVARTSELLSTVASLVRARRACA